MWQVLVFSCVKVYKFNLRQLLVTVGSQISQLRSSAQEPEKKLLSDQANIYFTERNFENEDYLWAIFADFGKCYDGL